MMQLLFHMLLYGLFGWGVEIVFTAIKKSVKEKTWKLEGFTTLWAFPLYASAAVFFEPLHDALSAIHAHWVLRGAIYTLGIYGIELLYGLFMVVLLKMHPWKYSGRLTLRGYVHFAYAPAWFAFSLFLEHMHNILVRIDQVLYR